MSASDRKEPYATARRRKMFTAMQNTEDYSEDEAASPAAKSHSREAVEEDLQHSIEEPSYLMEEQTESASSEKNIADAVDDLEHIESALLSAMISFSVSRRYLRFLKEPSSEIPFQRQDLGDPSPTNSGPFSLDPRMSINREFILYEGWLHATYWSLNALPTSLSPEVDDRRRKLIEQVASERERLQDVKELDWDAQAKGAHHTYWLSPEDEVSTVETDYLYERLPTSWNPSDAPIFATSVVAATLNLLYGVPLSTTTVLLAGLRSVTRLTLQYARESTVLPPEDERLLRFISRDPRTVLNAFNLDPCVQSYVCCPKCFALYRDLGDSRTTCSYRSTKTSEPCGSKLVRSRSVDESNVTYPIRVYLHQSLKHWLGRLLSRSDIEALLEQAPKTPPSSPMRDIFDAMALRNLLGPDRRTPFLDSDGDELRLIFSLSTDSFNPYQMKEAKKKVSSTAMYMVCLNLPPHLRYLPENVFLVGVIPGPTKPSMDQMNHFLALLVDELLVFWNPGVWYSRTSKMASGRRARAALVPLVCDLLAARQVAGLGQHNHKFMLCSFCGTTQDDVENTDTTTFPLRDLEAHREAAEAWLHAESTHERELLFSQTGIRYTELLRLPYWNPILYVVVDTMHNLYLGLLQRHIRDIWGINVDADDGEAIGRNSGKAPPRPSEDAMADGLDVLLYGDEKALRRCKKAVLYHLCADRDLRRAGTIAQLVKILQQWRSKKCLPAQRPARQDTLPNPRAHQSPTRHETKADTHNHATLRALKAADSRSRPASDVEVATAMRALCTAKTIGRLKFRKLVLVALCKECKVETNGSNPVLAECLLAWREGGGTAHLKEERIKQLVERITQLQSTPKVPENKFSDPQTPKERGDSRSKTKSTSGSVGAIGRTTLQAFVEDRSRMELPTWVNRVPAAFGTTQHGKLSADQWRTVGTINLPVTLIRTWGTELPELQRDGDPADRSGTGIGVQPTADTGGNASEHPPRPPPHPETLHAKLLRNFLDLVDAVETIGLLETDEEEIEHAEDALERYLNGLKELYQQSKIQPNHHLALHIGMFIRLFGPVHAWRAFAFERFNYMLQSIKASKNLGQMEVTFMMHSCRAANMRPLLRTEPVQSMMQELVEAHNRLSGEDRRGMRFDDMFRSVHNNIPRADPGKNPKRLTLEKPYVSALVRLLNSTPGTVQYSASATERRPGQLLLSASAIRCSKVSIGGVFYKPAKVAPGDSNIMVKHEQDHTATSSRPARIESIVLHSRAGYDGLMLEETFLFIRYLQELTDGDKVQDPYRKFPRVGGRLLYDAYEDDLVAIRPMDILSHFAKTRMDHLNFKARVVDEHGRECDRDVTFEKRCVHVRQLDRLHKHTNKSQVEGEAEAEEEDSS